MNIHLLDLFKIQFTEVFSGKIAAGLGIQTSSEELKYYCINSAYELIKELPGFYSDQKNQHHLLNELIEHSPDITTENVFEDVDLRTSSIIRNGKYFVHAIYGVDHLDFLKKIEKPLDLQNEQAYNLWYASGSVVLMLIHSLTNKENNLTNFLSILKKEVQESTTKKSSSFFMSLLSF